MRTIRCTETFLKPKWILETSGLWPVVEATKIDKLKLFLNYVFDTSIFVFVIYNGVRGIKSKNMKLLNKSVCIFIPMVIYTSKSWTLISNRNYFDSILADLESDIFNNHSEKLNQHIQYVHKISQILLRYFIMALCAYILFGSFLPLILNYGLVIPSPFEGQALDIYYRIYHFFGTAYMAYNCIGFDVFYLTLMNLCAGQLDILKERLAHVLEEATQCREEKAMKLRVHVILKECVILHQTLNKFIKKLSILLSFPLFVQYSCGCFIICNTILQLTLLRESGSTNVLVMCGYSFVTIGQMATFHWLGNEIIFKSDKIIEASYASKWYELDTDARKTLLILMESAKRPLVIQLYKLVFISLDSLVVIFRWSYSVFALIKARYS